MSYLVKLIIFSIIIAGAVFAWNSFVPQDYRSNGAYYILPFFIAYAWIVHTWLNKALNSENKNAFTMQFMGATGIKLFLSLIVLVIYGILNRPGIVPFAILYLFIYFTFTGFETIALFKLIKQQKTRPSHD
ncbi:MAG: hypothetical protein K0S33_3898 [Bacteroidetes bacterium]|jgi:hypothetical protein|nr:hypothetical protein [Bacteroidota bacterium]